MGAVESREQGCSWGREEGRKKYSSEPKRDFTEEGEILYCPPPPPPRPQSPACVEATPHPRVEPSRPHPSRKCINCHSPLSQVPRTVPGWHAEVFGKYLWKGRVPPSGAMWVCSSPPCPMAQMWAGELRKALERLEFTQGGVERNYCGGVGRKARQGPFLASPGLWSQAGAWSTDCTCELTHPLSSLLRLLAVLSPKLQGWVLSPWLCLCGGFSEWGCSLPQ